MVVKRIRKTILSKWVNKLNLNNIPIEFIYTNNNTFENGLCSYDFNAKKYRIFITPNSDKETYIHELGHIYFDKLTNALNYYQKNPFKNIYIRNSIEDGFVNYNLSKFNEFYDLINENIGRSKPINYLIKSFSLNRLLGGYIYDYLHWNFILKPKDRNLQKEIIDYNLNIYQKAILIRAKQEKIKFNQKDLFKLRIILNQFPKIKDLRDYKILKKYEDQVLEKFEKIRDI